MNTVPPPAPPTTRFYVEEPSVTELNSKYSIVPENFEHVDFRNRSYGLYKSPDVKISNLTLKDGEYWKGDGNYQGWFSLKDVYYTDVTGDGTEEAIVTVSHVSCDSGGSCDGGTYLIYVYTARNGKPRILWQYETGSAAYGCGLKSMTVDGRKLVLGLFGQCPKTVTFDSSPRKFIVKDSTFLLFEFDGHHFVQQSSEYVPTPSVDVRKYKPEIRIYESPSQPRKGTRDLVS